MLWAQVKGKSEFWTQIFSRYSGRSEWASWWKMQPICLTAKQNCILMWSRIYCNWSLSASLPLFLTLPTPLLTPGILEAYFQHFKCTMLSLLVSLPRTHPSHLLISPRSLCMAKSPSSFKSRLKRHHRGQCPLTAAPWHRASPLSLTPVPPTRLSASQAQWPRLCFSLQCPGHLVFSGQSISIYWVNK